MRRFSDRVVRCQRCCCRHDDTAVVLETLLLCSSSSKTFTYYIICYPPLPPAFSPSLPLYFSLSQPDTISALWVAADLDSREGTTFVDVVDFCFNCVLFMEREKEASNRSLSVWLSVYVVNAIHCLLSPVALSSSVWLPFNNRSSRAVPC